MCVCGTQLTTSISVLECPILQTMQPFFMRSRFSLTTTFLLPEGRKENNSDLLGKKKKSAKYHRRKRRRKVCFYEVPNRVSRQTLGDSVCCLFQWHCALRALSIFNYSLPLSTELLINSQSATIKSVCLIKT